MKRIPEPELMTDKDQAEAYAQADFEASHSRIVEHFQRVFSGLELNGRVVDLGCGSADITVRFAKLFPNCYVDAIDGAEAMLEQARSRIRLEHLEDRIRFAAKRLPADDLPETRYDALVSNSLLHHLHDPLVLWTTARRYLSRGAPVFVADLVRPQSREQACMLVEKYAGNEPSVLQRDFLNSLCAAFTPDEVEQQLSHSDLESLRVEVISDRHLLVHGYMPE